MRSRRVTVHAKKYFSKPSSTTSDPNLHGFARLTHPNFHLEQVREKASGNNREQSSPKRRLRASAPHQNKARHSPAGRFVPPSYAKITRTSTQAKKETHLFSAGELRQNASTWPRRERACPSNYEEGRRITKAQTQWLMRVIGRPSCARFGQSRAQCQMSLPSRPSARRGKAHRLPKS